MIKYIGKQIRIDKGYTLRSLAAKHKWHMIPFGNGKEVKVFRI